MRTKTNDILILKHNNNKIDVEGGCLIMLGGELKSLEDLSDCEYQQHLQRSMRKEKINNLFNAISKFTGLKTVRSIDINKNTGKIEVPNLDGETYTDAGNIKDYGLDKEDRDLSLYVFAW